MGCGTRDDTQARACLDVFGARRVGRTRLVEDYLASVPEQKWYKGHGEDRDLAERLEGRFASRLRQLFSLRFARGQ